MPHNMGSFVHFSLGLGEGEGSNIRGDRGVMSSGLFLNQPRRE